MILIICPIYWAQSTADKYVPKKSSNINNDC